MLILKNQNFTDSSFLNVFVHVCFKAIFAYEAYPLAVLAFSLFHGEE